MERQAGNGARGGEKNFVIRNLSFQIFIVAVLVFVCVLLGGGNWRSKDSAKLLVFIAELLDSVSFNHLCLIDDFE